MTFNCGEFAMINIETKKADEYQLELFLAVDDAALREVIRRHLDFDRVAGDDFDVVLAHSA